MRAVVCRVEGAVMTLPLASALLARLPPPRRYDAVLARATTEVVVGAAV